MISAIKKSSVFIILLIAGLLIWNTNAQPFDISGKYLMDRQRNRIINISRIRDDIYEISELSSSWPWKGCGIFDGRKIYGITRELKSSTSYMIRGRLLDDRSIEVEYVFLTDSNGELLKNIGPGRGRIDRHKWIKMD